MLVNSKELLAQASLNHYAIGAFNISNLETAQAVITAAHQTNSPVILQASQSAIKYAGLKPLVAMVKALTQDSELPFVLHLDHGPDSQLAMACIDAGFTSVMIDSSSEPWEKNIAITQEVVAYAHPKGVTVEAEIGQIGGVEDNVSVDAAHALYTDPQQAADFVAATQVDSLAIAIGTAHGLYQGEPKLDFQRLSDIQTMIPRTPLVLHGSSGVPADLLKKAISLGIAKINIDTDLRLAFVNQLRQELAVNPDSFDPRKLLAPARDAFAHKVIEKINIFGSSRS